MRKILALVFLLALPASALAQNAVTSLGVSDGTNTVNKGAAGPPFPFIVCDQTVTFKAITAATTIITHVPNKTTYICSYAISVDDTATSAAYLGWGTKVTNPCDTTPIASSGLANVGTTATTETGAGSTAQGYPIVDFSPVKGTSDLCLILVTGSTAHYYGRVLYAIL